MNNPISRKHTLLLTGLIGLVLLTCAPATFAADQRVLYRQQWYYGFNAASFKVTDETDSSHLNFSGLLMKAGVNVSRNLALEAHSGLTIKKSIGDILGAEHDGQISTSSVYLRGNLNFPDYTLFGLAGMTKLRSYVDGPVITNTTYSTSPAYGIGVDLFGDNTTAVTFQILRVFDDEDIHTDSINLGFSYYFDRLY